MRRRGIRDFLSKRRRLDSVQPLGIPLDPTRARVFSEPGFHPCEGDLLAVAPRSAFSCPPRARLPGFGRERGAVPDAL